MVPNRIPVKMKHLGAKEMPRPIKSYSPNVKEHAWRAWTSVLNVMAIHVIVFLSKPKNVNLRDHQIRQNSSSGDPECLNEMSHEPIQKLWK